MRILNIITLLVFSCLAAPYAIDAQTVQIKYLENIDNPNTYKYDLIKLALEQSGEPYELERIDKADRSDPGIWSEMSYSSEPLVNAMGTQPELEKKLLPVRVPMYLGIGVGFRMMLIRKDIQESLRSVRTLDDLKRFTIGQGLGWSDVPILRNAGLTVIEGPKYELLFAMTARGRFDLFSRGLFEIYPEYEKYKKEFPELAVDEHLVLVYPGTMYFFVPRSQQRVHDVIYKGLVNAYESGAMQKLLLEHPTLRDTIERAKLKDRVRIDLPPYNVTDETLEALKRFRLELK